MWNIEVLCEILLLFVTELFYVSKFLKFNIYALLALKGWKSMHCSTLLLKSISKISLLTTV